MALLITELDLAAPEGRHLLGTMAERHGRALGHSARLARRLFLLASPWAPGLRCVGGEADAAGLSSAVHRSSHFSLAGAGTSIEDGLASCLGEGVERLSQVEASDAPPLLCCYDKVAGQVMQSAHPLIET